MVGRGKSTISDELRINRVAGDYTADGAHQKAANRRRAAKFQAKRIVANQELRAFIDQALLGRLDVPPQSPGAIAGRLKAGLEPGLPYVSRDTIETYIRSVHGRKIEYGIKLLKIKQNQKTKRRRPGTASISRGDPKVYIDDRPDIIKHRGRVGDLEVDFIVSGKSGSGYALTAADRKLRVGFIRLVNPVSVGNALRALQSIKRVFPEMKSITTDNDILWRYHKKLEKALGVPFYFCHPYSSFEKGSIENYNGKARKYIHKGSDISLYSQAYIKLAEAKLNGRYLEVLGFRTPQEALEEYRKEQTKA